MRLSSESRHQYPLELLHLHIYLPTLIQSWYVVHVIAVGIVVVQNRSGEQLCQIELREPSPTPIETIELVYLSIHILFLACCSCHCCRCNDCSEQERFSSAGKLSSESGHQYRLKLLHLYVYLHTLIHSMLFMSLL